MIQQKMQEQNTHIETKTIETTEPKDLPKVVVNVIVLPSPKSVEVVKTTYDELTEDEIHMIEATIQHEVGNFSETYQTLIAELIYNRLQSDEFPDTVKEVLYQENQFCGIENWYNPNTEINEVTKEIVKSVFSKDTTSHDAVYYYNPELSADYAIEWFEYSGDVIYLFEYTEEDWGIKYTTRFFK